MKNGKHHFGKTDTSFKKEKSSYIFLFMYYTKNLFSLMKSC